MTQAKKKTTRKPGIQLPATLVAPDGKSEKTVKTREALGRALATGYQLKSEPAKPTNTRTTRAQDASKKS